MKRVMLVAGARPNFMKIAPIIDAIGRSANRSLNFSLVHTGQHFDERMSRDFFVQLGLPEPDVNLEAGGGSQAEQTAMIMVRFEQYLSGNPCDLVVVVGDVTSTLACSIVAKKAGIPVAHVEGGIRSGDMNMPEEVNRIVTDSIADYFFTTSRLAGENLKREGKNQKRIYFVGNTMIDSLVKHHSSFRPPHFWKEFSLKDKDYFVMTLHRPSNVDKASSLIGFLEAISLGANGHKVIFPIHPRTRKSTDQLELNFPVIKFVEPLGYLEFNYLVEKSIGVITDSGGITEETTVLGVPCITLRDTTERPETVSEGTNELIGANPERIGLEMDKMLTGQWKKGAVPELWDGHAADRIVAILTDVLSGPKEC